MRIYPVVLGWALSNPSPDAKQCRDIVKLNKMATIEGCTNAASVRSFHKEHEVLKKTHVVQNKKEAKLPEKYKGSIFGEPSRPSTPLGSLLKQSQKVVTEPDYPLIDRKRNTTPAVRSTKAARGQDVRFVGTSDQKVEIIKKEQFKMAKFMKVPSRISSQTHNNIKSPTAQSPKVNSLSGLFTS